MTVAAVKAYDVQAQDREEDFRGARLIYIGWDQHLLHCAPFCFPLPPDMPFQALIDGVIPSAFGNNPDFPKIDWSQVQWLRGNGTAKGEPFTPDPAKSLAENGLGHKDLIRFRTPGLTGLKGSGA